MAWLTDRLWALGRLVSSGDFRHQHNGASIVLGKTGLFEVYAVEIEEIPEGPAKLASKEAFDQFIVRDLGEHALKLPLGCSSHNRPG